MIVSPSRLKQFGGCARQYYYEHVLQIGKSETGSLTALGTVFHYTVDVYETYGHDLELAKRVFIYYWDHPDELGAHIDFWHRRTTKDGLRKRGLSMLEKYHELQPWRDGILIGTEVKFVVPIGDNHIRGIIDKLWYRPGLRTVEAIDFKTGSYVDKALRYNLQFTAYCYATERPEMWEGLVNEEFRDGYERFKGWDRQGWWYHARNNKMFNAGKRGPGEYKRLRLAVDEMERAIERDVYPLDYQGTNCGWCAFTEVCGSEVKDPALAKQQERMEWI